MSFAYNYQKNILQKNRYIFNFLFFPRKFLGNTLKKIVKRKFFLSTNLNSEKQCYLYPKPRRIRNKIAKISYKRLTSSEQILLYNYRSTFTLARKKKLDNSDKTDEMQ